MLMEYKSNLNEVLTNILGKLSGEKLDLLNSEIATTLQGSNLRRIHTDGLNTKLTRIGRYSLSPSLYINPKNSPVKFIPIGKEGKAQNFKNGKPHKTKFFRNYREFRKTIGRNASFVNLQLTGGLKASFKIKKLTNGYAIGFWSEKYSKIAEGMEEHFGKTAIWGVTEQDKKTADLIVERHMNNGI